MRELTAVVAAGGLLGSLGAGQARAASQPARARSEMVVSQHFLASQAGAAVLADGGGAVDAAVATAFALAVVHPKAGNIGGGGFLLYRPAQGAPVVFDFREAAPAGASPTMFLREGRYDAKLHHSGHQSVGVPGTVAGLHLAWQEGGRLPWRRLLEPAIALARDGFAVTDALARDIRGALDELRRYPASLAQFTRDGEPYAIGETLRQPELAATLERIAAQGPAGFYAGETARLLAEEMRRGGGLVTEADLAGYRARRREPLRGSYRGYEVLSLPPPSSGGTALLQMLNMLEGDDLAALGFGSAQAVHLTAEAMRRTFADRARFLGDPDFNPELPIERLTSKAYAARLRRTIRADAATPSSPERFAWEAEAESTTHLSVVDAERNAVSLTYTLEASWGSGIVVPGAGFLLNNEMGDFNAGPGLTDASGLIGTPPNLAAPGKRMLSSMTPTILTKDGRPFLVVGSPGGRTIINTVLLVVQNVVDYGMNAQQAVDAARFHHQWLPDRIRYERHGLSPDTLARLRALGHALDVVDIQGVAQAILVRGDDGLLEAGCDRRYADSGAAGR